MHCLHSSMRKHRSIRGFASLADQMAVLLPKRMQQYAIDNLKSEFLANSNANVWLSKDIVDTPTCSILDPVHNMKHSELKYGSNGFLAELELDQVDPFKIVEHDIEQVMKSIRNILGSDHPVLDAVAKYFFQNAGGKMVRPTMILLLSAAAREGATVLDQDREEFDIAAQHRLAEITEMIHTATLLHDDVIDEADTRRGVPAANKIFGDKMAILAGDFLLARSSISLARLRSIEAIELMSTAIEHLVKGEVMQMRPEKGGEAVTPFEYYLRKNYYKTGSLMSNSCKAALVLADHPEEVCEFGFAYGRHIGLAFQLIDDVLDYEGLNTGKPALADLKAGLATAPVLLAQEEYPELKTLIERKFSEEGDIEKAANLVQKSSGIVQTKDLAISQAELACDAISNFRPSPARDALMKLAQKVVFRTK